MRSAHIKNYPENSKNALDNTTCNKSTEAARNITTHIKIKGRNYAAWDT